MVDPGHSRSRSMGTIIEKPDFLRARQSGVGSRGAFFPSTGNLSRIRRALFPLTGNPVNGNNLSKNQTFCTPGSRGSGVVGHFSHRPEICRGSGEVDLGVNVDLIAVGAVDLIVRFARQAVGSRDFWGIAPLYLFIFIHLHLSTVIYIHLHLSTFIHNYLHLSKPIKN